MKKKLSSIAMLTPEGVKSIYTFWNGNTMHDAQILVNCWRDPKAVAVLIGLGDLISLGPNISDTRVKCRDFQQDWSTCEPRLHRSVEQWRRASRVLCASHYLYDPDTNSWRVWDEFGRLRPDVCEYEVIYE